MRTQKHGEVSVRRWSTVTKPTEITEKEDINKSQVDINGILENKGEVIRV